MKLNVQLIIDYKLYFKAQQPIWINFVCLLLLFFKIKNINWLKIITKLIIYFLLILEILNLFFIQKKLLIKLEDLLKFIYKREIDKLLFLANKI